MRSIQRFYIESPRKRTATAFGEQAEFYNLCHLVIYASHTSAIQASSDPTACLSSEIAILIRRRSIKCPIP